MSCICLLVLLLRQKSNGSQLDEYNDLQSNMLECFGSDLELTRFINETSTETNNIPSLLRDYLMSMDDFGNQS